MSRMKYDSTRGFTKKIHEILVEKRRILTEKEKPTRNAIDMFRHKAYSTDMRKIGGAV